MQAITDTIAGKYWWVLAIAGAAIALGLVLWRMPSIRASFAAMRCGKPAPPKRRVVEAESEYETDSDAGEIGEARLLSHLRAPPAPVVVPVVPVVPVVRERAERAERAERNERSRSPKKRSRSPKKRSRRRAEKPGAAGAAGATVTPECTE
jgi:hypothetical protein